MLLGIKTELALYKSRALPAIVSFQPPLICFYYRIQKKYHLALKQIFIEELYSFGSSQY